MTTRTRDVLRDCEAALVDLRSGPTGYLWRSRWNAAISRLRTVGYALRDVDREQGSGGLRTAIDAAWAEVTATKPEPKIFWAFIAPERHNVEHKSKFSSPPACDGATRTPVDQSRYRRERCRPGRGRNI